MKIISQEVKTLPEYKTISVSHTGPYDGIGTAFQKMEPWIDKNNLWTPTTRSFGVYYDDPSMVAAENLRSKACIEDLGKAKPEEGMEYTTITGGKYFVTRVEVTMAQCHQAWMDAYAKFNENIEKQGFAYDHRDHYELYIACPEDMQDPAAPWTLDLCIPMK